MKCPYCECQDIRSYIDRDYDLSWYLCWDCGYQGYDLRLFHDAWASKSEAKKGSEVRQKEV